MASDLDSDSQYLGIFLFGHEPRKQKSNKKRNSPAHECVFRDTALHVRGASKSGEARGNLK